MNIPKVLVPGVNDTQYKRYIANLAKEVTKQYHNYEITFSIPKAINKTNAKDVQIELGYHPYGYSFHSHSINNNTTTWKCWKSCD